MREENDDDRLTATGHVAHVAAAGLLQQRSAPNVRFTPESGRLLRCREMTLSANSDHSAPQQHSTPADCLCFATYAIGYCPIHHSDRGSPR